MYIFIFENIYIILITNHLKKKINKLILFSKLHMYIFNFPKFNMCNFINKTIFKKIIILFSKTYMYIFIFEKIYIILITKSFKKKKNSINCFV